MKNNSIVVVIPTLNPNIKIMSSFIEELRKSFINIVVVNDGSRKEYDSFFSDLESKNIVVLKHYINYGKGRALKTAYNYILNNYQNCECITTCDSDGQHSVKDILNCSLESLKNKNKLIIGVRDFSKDNVPIRSKFGNVITRNIFKLLFGLKITDTQTGLRSMSFEITQKFLNTVGERFEYETNQLIDCKLKNIEIGEVTIDTIYIDNNSESHFDPIKDSIKIYSLFYKYFMNILIVIFINILLLILFNKFINLSYNFLISCNISLLIYIILNRNIKFKEKNYLFIIRYFLLRFIYILLFSSILYILVNK